MLKLLSLFFILFFITGLSVEASETLVLLAFGYIGIVTHYIKEWSEKTERAERFILRKYLPSAILSIITTTVAIMLREELKAVFVFTKIGCFVAGYFGNSWFFGLIDKKISSNQNSIENENQD